MRRFTVGIVLVAVAVTAACGRGPGLVAGDAGPPPGTPAVHQAWTSCPVEVATPSPADGVDALDLPRLGDGFAPVAAIVCARQPERRPDGGEDLVQVESRADDVADLVAALRLPDQPRTDQTCTMDLPLVAWFVLLDAAGRWVRPGLPADACGKIRIEVRRAVWALRLDRISARTLSEIESAGAAASGCSQSWADVVSMEASSRSLAPARINANPLASAGQLRLCLYRVPASEQGTGKPGGQFERGAILTAQRRAAIEAALVLTVAARTCAAHANRFALLRAVDATGGEIYVELDGCQRILTTSGTGPAILAQADAALVAALDQP